VAKTLEGVGTHIVVVAVVVVVGCAGAAAFFSRCLAGLDGGGFGGGGFSLLPPALCPAVCSAQLMAAHDWPGVCRVFRSSTGRHAAARGTYSNPCLNPCPDVSCLRFRTPRLLPLLLQDSVLRELCGQCGAVGGRRAGNRGIYSHQSSLFGVPLSSPHPPIHE